MQTAGSGPDSPSTAIFATLPVTASGHPGNLGTSVRIEYGHNAAVDRRYIRDSSVPGLCMEDDTMDEIERCLPEVLGMIEANK